RSLSFTGNSSEPFNVVERRPKWFFNHTRNSTLKEFDSCFNNVVHRHDTNARIGLSLLKHLIQIGVGLLKPKQIAELICFVCVEVARGHQLNLTWMLGRISRKRRSMATPRMFTTTHYCYSDHRAYTVVPSERASLFFVLLLQTSEPTSKVARALYRHN